MSAKLECSECGMRFTDWQFPFHECHVDPMFEKALNDLETYAVLVGISKSAEESDSHRMKVATAQALLREMFYGRKKAAA